MRGTWKMESIKDWLSEYKVLSAAELPNYANNVNNNVELISALYDLFWEQYSEEVLDPVCHQLYEFYRSGNSELRRFTLEFIPTLIEVYLVAVSLNNKNCGGIEAYLLGIYNLEIVNKDGSARVDTFTIPTLAQPSIYHEPPSLATLALTESALLRYHSDEPVTVSVGPHPQIQTINSQNRLKILQHVLAQYNTQISSVSTKSLSSLCSSSSRLVKKGFSALLSGDADSDDFTNSTPKKRGIAFQEESRIVLTSNYVIELINGIYFAMFNGHAVDANQAVQDIHFRASYEMWSDVILVTNAISNSLRSNPSGQPQDGPIGISLALSPTASNPTFSKTAITNASFRTKRLPEDIDVPENAEEDLPAYEDVMDAEKPKMGAARISKPLKSIMKKAERGLSSRRESDASKRRSDGESPRHSAALSMNGDAADSSAVKVSIIQEGSHTMVDHIQMRSTSHAGTADHIEMRPKSISGIEPHHERTGSYTDSMLSEDSQENANKPLLHTHAEVSFHRQDQNSDGSNTSLNTPL